jgi:hypothetical protein
MDIGAGMTTSRLSQPIFSNHRLRFHAIGICINDGLGVRTVGVAEAIAEILMDEGLVERKEVTPREGRGFRAASCGSGIEPDAMRAILVFETLVADRVEIIDLVHIPRRTQHEHPRGCRA